MKKVINKTKQNILNYPAIFEIDAQGYYNVSFPAFPGCVTFGRTFEEAQKKAEEVLELWLEELAEQKKKIPVYYSRPIIADVIAKVPNNASLIYETT